ncbi:MAG: ATP-binding protein, partial [Deltaproteobacteria bacterium]|nr:ATP-binding protein [Deltaproteobacteria bacterium]
LGETLRCNEFSQGAFSFKRPFRTPHHSISAGAFLGGGTGDLAAGEVTLAHRGILFLDEFPEFRRDAIEGLREPLEAGEMHLHRVGRWLTLPARFTLIAAMNPCPCGYALDGLRCRCSFEKRSSYARRISGPILDRMDLMVVLDPGPASGEPPGTEDGEVIQSAVERQRVRYREHPEIDRNGDVRWGALWRELKIPSEAEEWIRSIEKEPVSLRALHKLMRVGRTIADLDDRESVTRDHIYQAWEYRCRFSPNSSISA